MKNPRSLNRAMELAKRADVAITMARRPAQRDAGSQEQKKPAAGQQPEQQRRRGYWQNRKTNRLTRMQDTRMAIAPYGDRRCSSHLSRQVRSMYEECKCTTSPSPQFACLQRGRKRLSREVTLHTELALEWPELVQNGRCKVQWLPNGLKKRILTSFC